jgi:hypothetical protein
VTPLGSASVCGVKCILRISVVYEDSQRGYTHRAQRHACAKKLREADEPGSRTQYRKSNERPKLVACGWLAARTNLARASCAQAGVHRLRVSGCYPALDLFGVLAARIGMAAVSRPRLSRRSVDLPVKSRRAQGCHQDPLDVRARARAIGSPATEMCGRPGSDTSRVPVACPRVRDSLAFIHGSRSHPTWRHRAHRRGARAGGGLVVRQPRPANARPRQ